MSWAELIFLPVLLVPLAFVPGFIFVRRLAWSPLEKLCGAVGLSLLLLYLWSFGGFVLHLTRWWSWLATVLCFAAGFVLCRDLLAFWRIRKVRRAVIAFSLLLAWTLALLALVRSYSGAGWVGDWYEHYQRTQVFLGERPVEAYLFGDYLLPARPPLMNVVAADVLAHGSAGFPAYQVTFAFLNLLIFFPLALMLPALRRRGSRELLVLTALLAANPMLVEQATYTWTKLLAGFFVVQAVWFYLAGLRKGDSGRLVWAFALLATGSLVHYSTGPYAVVLGAHFLWVALRRRPRRWRELTAGVAIGAAILATWFAWSVAHFGVLGTIASNTSVMTSRAYTGNQAARIAENVVDTLVPHPFRGVSLASYHQASMQGFVRDALFLIYEGNLVPAMGAVGGLLVLGLLGARLFVRNLAAEAARERRFWLWFLPATTLLGVAVVGERDSFGVAHICLPPLVLLGVALLAANLRRLPRWLGSLAVAGCAADLSFGVLLQFRVEHIAYRARALYGAMDAAPVHGPALSIPAKANFLLKSATRLEFLGDLAAPWGKAIEGAVVAASIVLLGCLLWSILTARHRPPEPKGRPRGDLPRRTVQC